MFPLTVLALCGPTSQDSLQARVQQAENERRTCRANLQHIANAEMAFRVKSRVGFTSNLSLLRDSLAYDPTCPNGGTYSVVVGVPEKAFTVHCSVLSHDAGELQPAGFSPGVNTDFDNPDAIDRRTRKDPESATCRANLATFSNQELAYRVRHGSFASDLSLLKDVSEKLPICPEGGSYSIIVGVPNDSFTIHCSIKTHDAGVIEPRGYAPGMNTR
jgi:hypothetical protein